ncbi:ester cyclase [Nesterenkonia suensis]
MSIDVRDVAERLDRAYDDRDLDAWLVSFAADAGWKNIPSGEEFVGVDGQRANYDAWNGPFPRGRCVTLTIRAGRDFAVAEFRGEGTHEGPLTTPEGVVEPTGRFISLAFCDLHEVREGLIVTTHRNWDLAGAARQLGLRDHGRKGQR